MRKKNPIEVRLELLSDQWFEFASAKEARLLCWQLAPLEVSMLEAFFACEADPRAAEHLDVFVPLVVPFTDFESHGAALSDAIADAYAQSREALRTLDLDASWTPPPAGARERAAHLLVRTCGSLRDHHALPGKLVLVLQPARIGDPPAYQRWLRQLALLVPEWMRVIVIDELAHPVYRDLLEPPSPEIFAVCARLDMEGALQEVSNRAGNLDTPGGQFRDLFVQLTNRLGQQDLEAAHDLADRALALVAHHRLGTLGLPIHMALGGGLLAAGRSADALAQFVAAEGVALASEQHGPAEMQVTCRRLRLQARFAQVSALLSCGAFARAAAHCEESAPLAHALSDLRAELDCRRLACFAWDRAGRCEEALGAGCAGLDVAGAMDPATRASSSFACLAEDLLRITASMRHHPARRRLERELERLNAPAAGQSRATRPREVA